MGPKWLADNGGIAVEGSSTTILEWNYYRKAVALVDCHGNVYLLQGCIGVCCDVAISLQVCYHSTGLTQLTDPCHARAEPDDEGLYMTRLMAIVLMIAHAQ